MLLSTVAQMNTSYRSVLPHKPERIPFSRFNHHFPLILPHLSEKCPTNNDPVENIRLISYSN